jgi:hypothetical protein
MIIMIQKKVLRSPNFILIISQIWKGGKINLANKITQTKLVVSIPKKKLNKHILAKVWNIKYRNNTNLSLLKGCKRINIITIIVNSKTLNKTIHELVITKVTSNRKRTTVVTYRFLRIFINNGTHFWGMNSIALLADIIL